jgi:hypothetical protein
MKQSNQSKITMLSEDEFLLLFNSENADELRNFTRRIENHPSSVIAFEKLYDAFCTKEDLLGDEEILERVVESIEEIKDHLFGLPPERIRGIFLNFSHHGRAPSGEATVSIETGWGDALAGLVTWDRWSHTTNDPVIAFSTVGFLADSIDYRCEPLEKPPALPLLYRYHPERFKAFHTCAETIGEAYRRYVDPVCGFLTIEQVRAIMGLVATEVNDKGMRYPLKLRQVARGADHIMEGVNGLVTAYGRFVQAGRQILDFPPHLVEMLAQTDVSDMPMNTIKMPYAAQYLHFGPQAGLELEKGWLVDGAYVESHGVDGDWRITITARPDNPEDARLWFVSPEPAYTQDFVQDYRQMDMSTAVTMVLSNRLAALNERASRAGGDITEKVREEVRQRGLSVPETTRLIDVSNERSKERIERVNQQHPIYLKALQLAVNALCYVTAYPDDIAAVWPEGTPATLQKKTGSSNAKEARRAASKLASLGYVPVHLCGRKLAEQMPARALPTAHDGHVAVHWRRGHWRNQPYGQGRSLRKLIWMMPVLVGATRAGEEPESGHLYLAS